MTGRFMAIRVEAYTVIFFIFVLQLLLFSQLLNVLGQRIGLCRCLHQC